MVCVRSHRFNLVILLVILTLGRDILMNPFGGRISVVAISSGLIVPRIANPLPEAAWVATYFGVTSIWDVDSATGLQRFGACWSLAMRALLVMSQGHRMCLIQKHMNFSPNSWADVLGHPRAQF